MTATAMQLDDFQFTTEWRAIDNGQEEIRAFIRFDDHCGNGRQDFAITGEIRDLSGREVACGCLHNEIAGYFPELAPFIQWHLTSTDGPLHYKANTLYWAERALRRECKYDGNLSPEKVEESARYAESTANWPGLAQRLQRKRVASHADIDAELHDIGTELDARLPALIDDFMAAMAEVRAIGAEFQA